MSSFRGIRCRSTRDDRPVPIPAEWRVFHIFLPTVEACPYPLLVNGAFASDLSRRGVPVAPDQHDYNRHLLRCVARVFRDELVPGLRRDGASTLEILRLLAATPSPGLHASAKPLSRSTTRCAKSSPSTLSCRTTRQTSACRFASASYRLWFPTHLGAQLRDLLGSAAQVDATAVPEPCGLHHASTRESPSIMGPLRCAPTRFPRFWPRRISIRSAFEEDPSGGFYVDPVLRVLERLWRCVDS